MDRIELFTQIPHYRELDSINMEPVLFECKIFPRHTKEAQSVMEKE